jgi:hypothetical protein
VPVRTFLTLPAPIQATSWPLLPFMNRGGTRADHFSCNGPAGVSDHVTIRFPGLRAESAFARRSMNCSRFCRAWFGF